MEVPKRLWVEIVVLGACAIAATALASSLSLAMFGCCALLRRFVQPVRQTV